jgi:dCMP deaminase
LAAEEVYKNRDRFIVIGLTGRSGSGCSTVARLLACDFVSLDLPRICVSSGSSDRDRKRVIIRNFAERNWKKFFQIRVGDIITSFILECGYDEFSGYLLDRFNKDISNIKDEYQAAHTKNKCLDLVFTDDFSKVPKAVVCDYVSNDLPAFADLLKSRLGDVDEGLYTSIYQEVGNNIRKYGVATPQNEVDIANIYALAHRINKLIKVLRKHNASAMAGSYFVIDAFRNPFEALFFQERYSAFYLFAVRCHDSDRIDRLANKYNFSKRKIEVIDARENPKETPLKSIDNFLSQDIATCIQLADIHLENAGKHNNTNFNDLKEQLARYVSLIQHPGLVNPSTNEKMMQIAFTAKLNSGCLSRKVGAVVTNSAGVPKSIGWNSSPEGQTSCLLRNAQTMVANTDPHAYSEYEQTNEQILNIARGYIRCFSEALTGRGINCSYCFKDMQNKKDGRGNQVHNRALHAEENAFLQVAKFGGEGLLGGKLYTTAAPCDLCSRKAYQIGIKEIYYIDPYPGIAVSHVLNVGQAPPKLILFRGAIGAAYHKVYSSILPYKDELYSYMKEDYFAQKKE